LATNLEISDDQREFIAMKREAVQKLKIAYFNHH